MAVRRFIAAAIIGASMFLGATVALGQEQPARTCKEPAVGVTARNLAVRLLINGMPWKPGSQDLEAEAWPTFFRQGENVIVFSWDVSKEAGHNPDAPALDVVAKMNTLKDAGKLANWEVAASETLSEWHLKAGADGAIPKTGSARITFSLKDYPLKDLPWLTNRDRPFNEADRAAVMAVVRGLQAFYEKKDFDALKKFDSFKEGLVAQAGFPKTALGAEQAKQMEDMPAMVTKMLSAEDWKPLAFDEKRVVIEKIDGANLVRVSSADKSLPFTGLTDGKRSVGQKEIWLSCIEGKWTKVY